ncbi:HvfA family oxazolone/thioamide-modified RiPP metallophore [Endothiovibrio diazotrophicus]
MNHSSKTPALLLGTALTLGLGAGTAAADANPFTLTDLGAGYMVAAEGSCGSSAKPAAAEGACGANKAEETSTRTAEKSGEGKCGSTEEPMASPKTGEGKCGNKG